MDHATFLNLYPAGIREVTLTQESLDELLSTIANNSFDPDSTELPEGAVGRIAGVTIYLE